MYVPLVGLSIAVIWIVADWAVDRPLPEASACTRAQGLLLLLYGREWRISVPPFWRDSHTLFEHTLAVTQ